MKEINGRKQLILWDAALIVAVLLYFLWHVSGSNKLIIGIQGAIILSTCVRNHIAAYKLNGKIY